jgi:hypothetical protein
VDDVSGLFVITVLNYLDNVPEVNEENNVVSLPVRDPLLKGGRAQQKTLRLLALPVGKVQCSTYVAPVKEIYKKALRMDAEVFLYECNDSYMVAFIESSASFRICLSPRDIPEATRSRP